MEDVWRGINFYYQNLFFNSKRSHWAPLSWIDRYSILKIPISLSYVTETSGVGQYDR